MSLMEYTYRVSVPLRVIHPLKKLALYKEILLSQ